MASFRILLVDDSPDFLKSAARFLAIDPQVMVVGYALSVHDALEHMSQLCPDLVLMDIAMPHMNGLEATRSIKAQPGAPRVVILTQYDTAAYRAAALAVGADGFIPKSEFGVQVLPLIRTLLNSPMVPIDGEKPADNFRDNHVD